MKRIICIVLCGILLLFSTLTLISCGNMGVFDTNFTINYVVIEENGNKVLHTVSKWYDSESDSSAFKTSCCTNYIWTSANRAVAYTNEPAAYTYDFKCGKQHK